MVLSGDICGVVRLSHRCVEVHAVNYESPANDRPPRWNRPPRRTTANRRGRPLLPGPITITEHLLSSSSLSFAEKARNPPPTSGPGPFRFIRPIRSLRIQRGGSQNKSGSRLNPPPPPLAGAAGAVDWGWSTVSTEPTPHLITHAEHALVERDLRYTVPAAPASSRPSAVNRAMPAAPVFGSSVTLRTLITE